MRGDGKGSEDVKPEQIQHKVHASSTAIENAVQQLCLAYTQTYTYFAYCQSFCNG